MVFLLLFYIAVDLLPFFKCEEQHLLVPCCKLFAACDNFFAIIINCFYLEFIPLFCDLRGVLSGEQFIKCDPVFVG